MEELDETLEDIISKIEGKTKKRWAEIEKAVALVRKDSVAETTTASSRDQNIHELLLLLVDHLRPAFAQKDAIAGKLQDSVTNIFKEFLNKK